MLIIKAKEKRKKEKDPCTVVHSDTSKSKQVESSSMWKRVDSAFLQEVHAELYKFHFRMCI